VFGKKLAKGLDERRLRWVLGLFFLALTVPTFFLIRQAFSRLELQTFRQHQLMAEELVRLVDQSLGDAILVEDARTFADYNFLVVAGDPAANFLQRSPLSSYPVVSAVPGVLGYFQVDADGALSTPLLPPSNIAPGSYGITESEHEQRNALQEQIHEVLARNRLSRGRAFGDFQFATSSASGVRLNALDEVESRARAQEQSAVAEIAGVAPDQDNVGQAAFDELSVDAGDRDAVAPAETAVAARRSGAVERDLQESNNDSISRAATNSPTNNLGGSAERQSRKEQISVPEPRIERAEQSAETEEQPAAFRISTFESELDPFEISLLDTGHLVMFRDVWREGQRYVQGALIEREPFLQIAIAAVFNGAGLSDVVQLLIGYEGNVLSSLSGDGVNADFRSTPSSTVLYQARLSPPFANIELAFGVDDLPVGPGYDLMVWVTVVLLSVLLGGFFVMYRFSLRQILLTRQQQDFVSAVSHELKTPLTSIRMYGEMLKAGWADDKQKQNYYEYIYDESERLSRLIENVLQLARMTRSNPKLELEKVRVGELLDRVQSRIVNLVEGAGFELQMTRDSRVERAEVELDTDSFMQIVINLVDNAVKFSANADQRVIQISGRAQRDGTVLFAVRDFGPGVPRSKMRKLFELFYRAENELTRSTAGTGIGLALVQQLATAMNGTVDVRNREPGAEFRLCFPMANAQSDD